MVTLQSPGDRLLSISDTAKLLGVSIRTLEEWDKSGELKPLRVGKRSIRRYLYSQIQAYISRLKERQY